MEQYMEQYKLQTPQQFDSVKIIFTKEALKFLSETTLNDSGMPVSNYLLYLDLLSRMQLRSAVDGSYRRPIDIEAGQAQFSEIRLVSDWQMGRKKIHNLLATMSQLGLIEMQYSRVASVMLFTGIESWAKRGDNNLKRNPARSITQGSD